MTLIAFMMIIGIVFQGLAESFISLIIYSRVLKRIDEKQKQKQNMKTLEVSA